MGGLAPGEQVFYGLYYVMTGLHGLHIIIGIALMGWVLMGLKNGRIREDHPIRIKSVTLYWDFVHLIWVFLFPLFYMIGA